MNAIKKKIISLSIFLTFAHLPLMAETESGDEEYAWVQIGGISHLAGPYDVSQFYLNLRHYSSVTGPDGGAFACCVRIPFTWSPEIRADIRWKVVSRSHISDELARPRQDNIVGLYKALVPIERYTSPNTLRIHFFPGNKVRAISSSMSPANVNYPISKDVDREKKLATEGERISEILSDKEKGYINSLRSDYKRGENNE